MAVKRGDYYSFEYECVLTLNDEDGVPEDYDTTITVDAAWNETKKIYEVGYIVTNTNEMDFQDDYDLFKQVEGEFLSDLAKEGVGRSSLEYP
jgi:hypothetical protein